MLISWSILILSTHSIFGQGYFLANGNARSVWDGFSSDTMNLAATIEVAFLWGPTNSLPLVDSIQTSTGTNTPVELIYVAAWNYILNDSNFQLATDGLASAQVQTSVFANGAWSYTTVGGFSSFPVNGTLPDTDYNVFVIGWDKVYLTPSAAAAAGSVVGWSSPFIYHTVNNIGTPLTFTAAGFRPFGVSIPEPSMCAFGPVGFLSLRWWRRKVRKINTAA